MSYPVSGANRNDEGTISTYDDNYALSVSMTTRKPRAGERRRASPIFVEKKEAFEQTIAEGWSDYEYTCYCSNYLWNTQREYVESCLDKGQDVISGN